MSFRLGVLLQICLSVSLRSASETDLGESVTSPRICFGVIGPWESSLSSTINALIGSPVRAKIFHRPVLPAKKKPIYCQYVSGKLFKSILPRNQSFFRPSLDSCSE